MWIIKSYEAAYFGTNKRAEDGLDKINEDMKEAEKNLNQMEKICGIFTCPCGRKNAVVEPSKVFGKLLYCLKNICF